MKVKAMKRQFALFVVLSLFLCSAVNAQIWRPDGPIKIMVAFNPGGAGDTLIRLIADELQRRTSWEMEVENVTGRGGINMALALKFQPKDGTAIGFGVTETFDYNIQAALGETDALDHYSFLLSVARSQLGLVSLADRKMKSLDDLVVAGRGGQTFTVGVLSPRLNDLTRLMERHFGVDFETVQMQTSESALKAVIDGEVDLAWVSILQASAIKDDLVTNLASGEQSRLRMSIRAKTLARYGLDFSGGVRYMFLVPRGLPESVRERLTDEIGDIVRDSSTLVNKYIKNTFGAPFVIQGRELIDWVEEKHEESGRLLRLLDNGL